MTDVKSHPVRTKKPIRRFHQASATLMLLILSAGLMAYTGVGVMRHAQPSQQPTASGEPQAQTDDRTLRVNRIGRRAGHTRGLAALAFTRDFEAKR